MIKIIIGSYCLGLWTAIGLITRSINMTGSFTNTMSIEKMVIGIIVCLALIVTGSYTESRKIK